MEPTTNRMCPGDYRVITQAEINLSGSEGIKGWRGISLQRKLLLQTLDPGKWTETQQNNITWPGQKCTSIFCHKDKGSTENLAVWMAHLNSECPVKCYQNRQMMGRKTVEYWKWWTDENPPSLTQPFLCITQEARPQHLWCSLAACQITHSIMAGSVDNVNLLEVPVQEVSTDG